MAPCPIVTNCEQNNWMTGWKGPSEKMGFGGLQTLCGLGSHEDLPRFQATMNGIKFPHVPLLKFTCLRKHLRITSYLLFYFVRQSPILVHSESFLGVWSRGGKTPGTPNYGTIRSIGTRKPPLNKVPQPSTQLI